jgi:hypothetical protein
MVVTACAMVLAGLSLAAEPAPELARLEPHVMRLASPEFAGRRGEGARKAEAYVVEELRSLGLAPLFEQSYTQDIRGRDAKDLLGRNVGARLEGADPLFRNEWIILSAHYDHLGTRGGVLYPGADDNASGVAMLLEVARCVTQSDRRPRRSVMFVAFDLEENGLFGSRYFVDRPPVPLESIALFITADLIGRSLGGVCKPYVFAMGSEHTPGLRPWIERAAAGSSVHVGLLGSDLLLVDRSDYGPFRARKVPYLFFSTGENPCYHSPDDKPETLDYPKLESISRIIHRIVAEATAAEEVPRWSSAPDHTLAEAAVICDVLKTLLAHRDELKIKPAIVLLMTRTIRQLDGIAERGAITASERTQVVRMAQIVLFAVF